MYFKRLEVSQFRNLTSASLFPSSSLNLISGSNGSGKSSLLEAIYYLATGSSFRTSRLANIVQHKCDCFTLFTETDNSISHKIGLQRCRNLKHSTRIDGREIQRRSELVQLFPVQVISPDSIELLTEASEYRRNFIDWSLFHVEHTFHFFNSHYYRALKQRNALLKSETFTALEQWDSQIIEYGTEIDTLRRNYITTIEPLVKGLLVSLLPDISLQLQYRSGWPKDQELGRSLKLSRETDAKMRHTTVGPHRADINIRANGFRASEVLSRGQLKLLVIALKLAQILSLRSESDKKPIILIDDIAAELDIEHRAILLDTILALETQVFITTPDLNLIDVKNWQDKKLFHVEHGVIKEVV